jgi:hypothetical protein
MLAALSGVLLTTLLARLLLSAALLAALSGVLLTTLLARLLLSATLLAATLALLARLLFTRVHNGSFVGPPTYNETVPSKFPGLGRQAYTAALELKPRRPNKPFVARRRASS